MTITNELIREIIRLRSWGLTYDQVDNVLGLESKTANSSYAIMKRKAAKAVVESTRVLKAVEALNRESL